MRILFATTLCHLPQATGGSQSSTHDLCVALRERGHSVGVLCSIKVKGKIGIVNRLKKKAGIYSFPRDTYCGYPVFRGHDPLAGVDEIISRFRPDVISVQAGKTMPLAQQFVSRSMPTVAYLRDTEFDWMGGVPFAHPNIRYIANSNFTANETRNQSGVKCEVIRPLIDKKNYLTETARESVLHVNPHPLKGIETTLWLADRCRDITFDIYESWPIDPSRLEEYRRQARESENIRWHQRTCDMREAYSRAGVLIVPSKWEEAWGRIVTEAQMNGIPVLASDRGGLPESVGPGGVIISAEAPLTEWEAALRKMWHNKNYYEHLKFQALRHSCREEICREKIIADFEQIHLRMCDIND